MTCDYGDCSHTCDGQQSRIVYCQCTATGGSDIDGSATSGSATDGSATGGSAKDGSATGGSATSGSATGGSATSGSVMSGSAVDGFPIYASDADCKREDPRLRPVSTRRCGVECANYTWFEGPWGLCDKVCAPGNQTRTVYCKKQTATSDNSTDDSDCEAIGPKPATQRDCDFDCQYVIGRWGNCSESCGGGIQNRSVVCQRKEDGNSTKTVEIHDCEDVSKIGPRPPSNQECNKDPCGKFVAIAVQVGHQLRLIRLVCSIAPVQTWKLIPGPCSHSCGGQG